MSKRGEQRPPQQSAAEKDAASGEGRRGRPFPVHEHVGRRLKEMFDEVTTQPIPEKFVKLLEELEQRQSRQARPGSPESNPSKPVPSKPKSPKKPRSSK